MTHQSLLMDSMGVLNERKDGDDDAEEKKVDLQDLRIGVIGNVDSGKSTLIGVMVTGELDDGRGSARQQVLRFKHEQDNGRTSSISHHILGFDADGNPKHQTAPASAPPTTKNKSWRNVVENSCKIVTFVDLCGHEKYLKTTVAGLVGSAVHYACVLVGGNMGVQKMTKEHIGVAVALEIPMFIVVTKVDLSPEKVLKETLKDLFKILKHPHSGKFPVVIKKDSDIEMCFSDKNGSLEPRICPVFLVSTTTGTNIGYLKKFLQRLNGPTARTTEKDEQKAGVMQIDETFSVTGVGTVVSGVLTSGQFQINQQVLLGPFSTGEFKEVTIRGLHVRRSAVNEVTAGVYCALALRGKNLKREQIRRGMVLVQDSMAPTPVYRFEAEILILHHPTTIKNKYQCVIHCGCTRQAANLHMKTDDDALRTGDRAKVVFEFLYYPEWMSVGDKIILREGNTKGVGRVTKLN